MRVVWLYLCSVRFKGIREDCGEMFLRVFCFFNLVIELGLEIVFCCGDVNFYGGLILS